MTDLCLMRLSIEHNLVLRMSNDILRTSIQLSIILSGIPKNAILLSFTLLSVILLFHSAQRCYTKCHSDKCHFSKYHSTKWHTAKWYSGKCQFAVGFGLVLLY